MKREKSKAVQELSMLIVESSWERDRKKRRSKNSNIQLHTALDVLQKRNQQHTTSIDSSVMFMFSGHACILCVCVYVCGVCLCVSLLLRKLYTCGLTSQCLCLPKHYVDIFISFYACVYVHFSFSRLLSNCLSCSVHFRLFSLLLLNSKIYCYSNSQFNLLLNFRVISRRMIRQRGKRKEKDTQWRKKSESSVARVYFEIECC